MNWSKPRTRTEEAWEDYQAEMNAWEYLPSPEMTPEESAERDSRERDELAKRMTYLLARRAGMTLFPAERKAAQNPYSWQEHIDELDRIDEEQDAKDDRYFSMRAIRQD